MAKKREDRGPPALMSDETLAYYLDCSARTIRTYVESGHLPPPIQMGNLTRWHWPTVEAHIMRRTAGGIRQQIHDVLNSPPDPDSPYLAGIARVEAEIAQNSSS